MKKGFLIIFALSLFSCSNSVSIEELFQKNGCSGPCYKRMPCEGESITIRIPLTGDNILENGNIFFVRAEVDVQKTIKLEFGNDVPESVKQAFGENIGKTAFVSGHIEGYDLLNPVSCKRSHIIYVENEESVVIK